jgi:hypothetical protein
MDQLELIRGTTPENASASASNSISPVGGASSAPNVTITLMGNSASTATKVADLGLSTMPVPESKRVFDQKEADFQALLLDLQGMAPSKIRKRTNELPTSLEPPATRAKTNADMVKQFDCIKFMDVSLLEWLTAQAKGHRSYSELEEML